MWSVWVLLWKHSLQRKRRYIRAVFDYFTPILYFVLLHLITGRNVPDKYETIHLTEPVSLTTIQKYQHFHVLFTPNNSITNKLMDQVGPKMDLPRLNHLPTAMEAGYYPFSDGSAMQILEFSKNMKFGHAIIIFENMESGTLPQKLKYTIRTKSGFVTSNIEPEDPFNAGHHQRFGEQYETFMSLQWAIDSSFLMLLTEGDIDEVVLQEFPYAAKQTNQNALTLMIFGSYMLPFALTLTFTFLTGRLFEEKNTGVHELVKMVGVSWEELTASHILELVPHMLIYAGVGTFIIEYDYSAPGTNGAFIFVSLALHFLTIVALALVVVYVFNLTQYLELVSMAVYLGCAVGSMFTTRVKSRALSLLCCLLPQDPFVRFWNILGTREALGGGITASNMWSRQPTENVSVAEVYLFMILQMFLLSIFAWYLSRVRPGRYGQALPWNFPFRKEYWSIQPRVEAESEETQFVCEADQKYFEKAPAGLPVGIQINDVFKSFGKEPVLHGVNLTVYRGEITVLLGHNGAGKTTLINIITGLISASSGRVLVEGKDTVKQAKEVRKLIGLCPQENIFFPNLTVLEHTMFFALLKGQSYGQARTSAYDLFDKLQITSKANGFPSALSGGMRRRAQLSCAIAGGARVLVLDEPTSGLDVETRRELWDLLLNLRGTCTVLLTTHFMEEADALGDRVAALHRGALRCHATAMFLKRAIGNYSPQNLRGTCTVLLTTHFMEEADALGDRVAALHRGALRCHATAMFLKRAIGNYSPQNLRGTCTVLLTTHFMEEADALGDRVAALHRGALRCHATAMFLKRAIGNYSPQNLRGTCTVLLTTHFMEEADALGDRVAALHRGALRCHATAMFLKRAIGNYSPQNLRGTCTVLLTTHFMEEADALGDRVAALHRGALRCHATAMFLKRAIGNYSLQNLRGTCTVLLTTHFMEEADALGDRVAALHRGALRCHATAMFLKRAIGNYSPQNLRGTCTVLLTTHFMEEADALGDRVAALHRGALRCHATAMFLKRAIGNYSPQNLRGTCTVLLTTHFMEEADALGDRVAALHRGALRCHATAMFLKRAIGNYSPQNLRGTCTVLLTTHFMEEADALGDRVAALHRGALRCHATAMFLKRAIGNYSPQNLRGTCTVLLTTHFMEEADALGDRVAALHRGALRCHATAMFLKRAIGNYSLQNLRGTCTVLLTTHFMEEADALGDRVAALHRGALRCHATAMFLKRAIGNYSPQNLRGTCTVLLTTHFMEEADALGDRVAALHRGALRCHATAMFLKRAIGNYSPQNLRGTCTVLLTTHFMEEADALGDRVAALHRGALRCHATAMFLKRAIGNYSPQNLRGTCTVLLTTHFMEEADALGDRVAALHRGALRCHATAMFLKRAIGNYSPQNLRGTCTVLLTTHFMEEADALGDRVAALHRGALRCHATAMFLKRAIGNYSPQNLRGTCTVLLTTHFMEEADALGDRVAALHRGALRCHATAMFLKRAIGNYSPQNLRGTCTVLLTTHFMEEADALGDRVAALHRGALRCHATAMFLKRAIGTGYRLSLTTIGAPQESSITSAITAHVSSATVRDRRPNGVSYNLPATDTPRFPSLFAALEDKRSELRIDTIGVGKSTLDEVFLELCSDDKPTYSDELDNTTTQPVHGTVSGVMLYVRQFTALLLRQVRYIMSHLATFLVVMFFVILLFWAFTSMANNDLLEPSAVEPDPAITLNLDLYSARAERRAAVNVDKDILNFLRKRFKGVQFEEVTDVAEAMLQMSKKDVQEYNKYLVGLELNETSAKVLYTTTVRHAAPVALNLLSNALCEQFSHQDSTITTINHPIKGAFVPIQPRTPYKMAKHNEQRALWTSGVAMVMLFYLCSFCRLPCTERVSGARHAHVQAGAARALHWAATLAAQLAQALLVCVLPVLILAATVERDSTFNQPGFTSSLFLVLVVGVVAFLAFVYFVTTLANPSAASAVLAISAFVFTQLTPNVPESKSFWYKLLTIPYVLLPPHTLSVALERVTKTAQLNAHCNLNRALCPALAMPDDHSPAKCCESPLGSEPWGYFAKDAAAWPMLILACQVLGYLVLTYLSDSGALERVYERVCARAASPPPRFADTMARAEAAYVEKAIQLPKKQITDSILCHNVQKVYPGCCKRKPFFAVKGVSFSVKKGECFGLLGVNGAGKTTTFKMLTSQITPTGGDIFSNGHFASERSAYMRTFSYCPQFGGLDEFLTGRQNLALLLTLRGLQAEDVATVSNSWIEEVDLSRHADKRLGTYSGGCARRLVAAAALCQAVRTALLDEPTSGVDPLARRKMHQALLRARKHHELIIASHSLDEMEALCHRIAIMSGGELRALGSAAALKAAHAQGYSLVFKLGHAQDVTDGASSLEEFKGKLHSCFTCELQDQHQSMLSYHVKDSLRYSELFAQLEQLREQFPSLVEDYTVTETTLEEVFLALAKEARAPPTV